MSGETAHIKASHRHKPPPPPPRAKQIQHRKLKPPPKKPALHTLSKPSIPNENHHPNTNYPRIGHTHHPSNTSTISHTSKSSNTSKSSTTSSCTLSMSYSYSPSATPSQSTSTATANSSTSTQKRSAFPFSQLASSPRSKQRLNANLPVPRRQHTVNITAKHHRHTQEFEDDAEGKSATTIACTATLQSSKSHPDKPIARERSAAHHRNANTDSLLRHVQQHRHSQSTPSLPSLPRHLPSPKGRPLPASTATHTSRRSPPAPTPTARYNPHKYLQKHNTEKILALSQSTVSPAATPALSSSASASASPKIPKSKSSSPPKYKQTSKSVLPKPTATSSTTNKAASSSSSALMASSHNKPILVINAKNLHQHDENTLHAPATNGANNIYSPQSSRSSRSNSNCSNASNYSNYSLYHRRSTSSSSASSSHRKASSKPRNNGKLVYCICGRKMEYTQNPMSKYPPNAVLSCQQSARCKKQIVIAKDWFYCCRARTSYHGTKDGTFKICVTCCNSQTAKQERIRKNHQLLIKQLKNKHKGKVLITKDTKDYILSSTSSSSKDETLRLLKQTYFDQEDKKEVFGDDEKDRRRQSHRASLVVVKKSERAHTPKYMNVNGVDLRIIKEGFMMKKGNIWNKAFKKRYFKLLQNRYLYYYKSFEDGVATDERGYADLTVVTQMIKKGKNGLEITTPAREWKFLCTSSAERDEWYYILKQLCVQKSGSKHASSHSAKKAAEENKK